MIYHFPKDHIILIGDCNAKCKIEERGYYQANGAKSSKLCYIKKSSQEYNVPMWKHSSINLDLPWWEDSQADQTCINKQEMEFKYTLYVPSFRGNDCDTDHYLVTAQVRETLLVRKQTAQKLDVDRSTLKNLSELQVGNSIRLKSWAGIVQSV